jgi:hypothetical protein
LSTQKKTDKKKNCLAPDKLELKNKKKTSKLNMEPRFNSLTDLAYELITPANLTRTGGIILLVPVISAIPWLTMSGDLGGIIGLSLLGTTIGAITTGNPGFLYPAIGGLIGIGIGIKIGTIMTYKQIDQMMDTNIGPLICNIKKY